MFFSPAGPRRSSAGKTRALNLSRQQLQQSFIDSFSCFDIKYLLNAVYLLYHMTIIPVLIGSNFGTIGG